MIPAVALAHPDDFVRGVVVIGKFPGVVINESLALLVHDGLWRAGFGVHGNDAENLVAATIVKKSEPAGIRPPADFLDAPGVGEQVIGNENLPLVGEVEEARARHVDFVAGLVVIVGKQLWLNLVARRGLDEINLAVFALDGLQDDELPRIRRPEEFPAVEIAGGCRWCSIEIPRRTGRGQKHCCPG